MIHLNVSDTKISYLHHPAYVLSFLSHVVRVGMAPVPDPAVWNPIAPIQNNWNKIEPWQKGYMAVLGGLGTIFAFASTIALIAEHRWRLPKWPFTAARWNPKPTVDKDKDEVTDEQIVDDELAEVVGALNKRNLNEEDELEWFNEDLYHESLAHFVKRQGISHRRSHLFRQRLLLRE